VTSRISPSSSTGATDMFACHQCGQKLHQDAKFLKVELCAIGRWPQSPDQIPKSICGSFHSSHRSHVPSAFPRRPQSSTEPDIRCGCQRDGYMLWKRTSNRQKDRVLFCTAALWSVPRAVAANCCFSLSLGDGGNKSTWQAACKQVISSIGYICKFTGVV
jgi:hypothetical protein